MPPVLTVPAVPAVAGMPPPPLTPLPVPPAPPVAVPTQTPALHIPLGHALLHEPQWAALVVRFSQAAPQAVSPGAQLAEQADNEQSSPAPQAFPQVPQFWGSDWTLLHTPPHDRWPAGQVSVTGSGEFEHALALTKLATTKPAKIPKREAKRVMGLSCRAGKASSSPSHCPALRALFAYTPATRADTTDVVRRNAGR